MKRWIYSLAATVCFAANAMAQVEYDGTPDTVLESAAADCSGFQQGQFSVGEKAVQRFALGDDEATFIDALHFSCTSAASMWGGTGGTTLWVVVDNTVYRFLARGWQLVDTQSVPVLLLRIHPSECGAGLKSCYRAYAWDEGFSTVR
ncbi:hypothetical protein GCM10007052_29040 [Halioglobus japonicus]|nr:hypothetical protein [Halioglobus japonicus]GHD20094.1 hypothetical protein GCM10007052_29040 [Halioglobus japonicus]